MTLCKQKALYLTAKAKYINQNTVLQAKREQIEKSKCSLLGEVFAVAKVKLLCSEVCATHK